MDIPLQLTEADIQQARRTVARMQANLASDSLSAANKQLFLKLLKSAQDKLVNAGETGSEATTGSLVEDTFQVTKPAQSQTQVTDSVTDSKETNNALSNSVLVQHSTSDSNAIGTSGIPASIDARGALNLKTATVLATIGNKSPTKSRVQEMLDKIRERKQAELAAQTIDSVEWQTKKLVGVEQRVATETVEPGTVAESKWEQEEVAQSTQVVPTQVLEPVPSILDASLDFLDPNDTDTDISGGTNSVLQPEIQYNAAQSLAIDYAKSGHSFVLTGPAGSGKTTTLKGVVQAIIDSNTLPQLTGDGHKYLPNHGTAGIVICGFTNKAVENAKKHFSRDIQQQCLTIHKLLEYEPTEDAYTDPKTGEQRSNFRYEPKRNRHNPLPDTIRTIIVEEASMKSVELWNTFIQALPKRSSDEGKYARDIQIIFVGDIQQLPPVFGKSIFIHAMQRGIRTIELTEVYRQALESPILALAHRILSGKVIPAPELPEWNIDKIAAGNGKLTIACWKVSTGQDGATILMNKKLCSLIDSSNLDPEFDVILTPWKKAFGTTAFNQAIAGHYAKKLGAEVHEIYAAGQKIYLREGERVLVNKTEYTVVQIERNPHYTGKRTRDASPTMDYQGMEHDRSRFGKGHESVLDGDDALDWMDQVLHATSGTTDDDNPTKRAGSHCVTVKSRETDFVRELKTSGELAAIELAYALTIHKAQGSEYRRVFLIFHKCQANMTFRELLYTGVTRAREELMILCETSTFVKGITSQRLPGKNITEKIKHFDRMLELDGGYGTGNDSQIPKELERFL